MPAPGFDFQRIYRQLLSADTPQFCTAARNGIVRAGSLSPDTCTDRQLEELLALFFAGDYARCWQRMDGILNDVDAARDPCLSALEAARSAFATGRLLPAVDCCAQLLERHSRTPDLYCVLGDLLLLAKKRDEAHTVFRRGCRVDPGHGALRERVRRMGVRRSPPLHWLPRSHVFNRTLGRVRSRLLTYRPVPARADPR